MKKYGKSLSFLKKVKESNLSGSEKIERAQLLASLFEKMDDLEMAKAYLVNLSQEWKGEGEKLAPLYYHLAKLNLKTKQYDFAKASIDKSLNQFEKMGKTDSKEYAKALELKAEILVALGKKIAAVDVYMNLLKNFESKMPLESVRYKAGLILFEEGDLMGAKRIWSRLKTSSKKNFYAELAEEKMKSEEWFQKYKKYMDRFPALSSSSKRSQ
ncbi:MAG: hypothetical protein D6797_07365 [Bdellovibrio sp.]|nr:MAG: hypothetical protein D6797_07365 [Bdellovibrio sp.]